MALTGPVRYLALPAKSGGTRSLLSWLTPGDFGNTSGSGTDPEDVHLSSSFLPQPRASRFLLPLSCPLFPLHRGLPSPVTALSLRVAHSLNPHGKLQPLLPAAPGQRHRNTLSLTKI